MQQPPVLAWHKVGTPEWGGTWCTRQQFAAQLDGLSRAGWSGLSLPEFETAINATQAPGAGPAASSRSLLITFDDAFTSFGVTAWPLLRAGSWPVVLFVVTDFVGRRATWDLALPGRRVLHLDWPALRELARQGVAIGSHAATHRDLRSLDDRSLEAELAGSRAALEDALGVAVHSVAYPFGRSDPRVAAAAAAAGYTLGFSLCPEKSAVDRFALRRHAVYRSDGPQAVLDKVDSRRALHRFQDVFERGANACAALVTRRP